MNMAAIKVYACEHTYDIQYVQIQRTSNELETVILGMMHIDWWNYTRVWLHFPQNTGLCLCGNNDYLRQQLL